MGSMMAHRIRINRTEPEIDWSRIPVSQTEYPPQVYDFSFPKGTTLRPCPFNGLPGYSKTCNRLRNHFNRQHWGDSIRILEEKPYPFYKCDRCRSQVPTWRINSRHYESEKSRLGEVRPIMRETLQHCFEASQVSIWVIQSR